MKMLVRRSLFATFPVILFAVVCTFAQTSEFTYQGKLSDTGAPSATYDFRFNLCNTLDCESVLDSNSRLGVLVTGGVFAVKLNFAPGEFSGADRFLEVKVKRPSDPVYTTLLPREKIGSTPYSIHSSRAANSLNLGGIAANQYVLTSDPRLSPDNYVQNTGLQQAGATFNIGGTGIANIFSATTQFNLNNSRILSSVGVGNLFVGLGSGWANSGTDNSFFGTSSGLNNSTGSSNSFFGNNSGMFNQTGASNSFFGHFSGRNNTTGSSNSFFGGNSGWQNTTGQRNAIFGSIAGFNNASGSNNSFFGWQSGFANTSGDANTFVGGSSGKANTTGYQNSFFGTEAGGANTTGNSNAFFGFRAGWSNTTGFSNSIFGDGAGSATSTGSSNSFFGKDAGQANTTGGSNSFFGTGAGIQNTSGILNTFVGAVAGGNNTIGQNNVFIGSGAGNPNVSTQVSNSVAIGSNATVSTSNTIVLGTTAQSTQIFGAMRAGIFNGLASVSALDVVNSAAGGGVLVPNLYIRTFAQGASGIHLCWKAAADGIQGNIITNCSSPFSEEALKQNIQPFTAGLTIVKRLKPVAFKWKADGVSDVGLNAEDVALVAPELVTRNDKGKAEDVKETSLSVVLINALKEQQEQIESQQKQIETLRRQVNTLNKLFCSTNTLAEMCKEQ